MKLHPVAVVSAVGFATLTNASEPLVSSSSSSSAAAAAAPRRDVELVARTLQGGVGDNKGKGGAVTCPEGEDSLQINVKFDSYPEDFQLELVNDETKVAYWKRDDKDRKYTVADQQSYATTSTCLPQNVCWRLTVYDTHGDGLTFNSLPTGIGGGFRILFDGRTIDYYTGQFNGCFSTKWYRFGDACGGGPAYAQYGYTVSPGCDDFKWDFSPTGILPGDLEDGDGDKATTPGGGPDNKPPADNKPPGGPGKPPADPIDPPPPPLPEATTEAPSGAPSVPPSAAPSDSPSDVPSDSPSGVPSASPTGVPSDSPSDVPSDSPTLVRSDPPSDSPSVDLGAPTEVCTNFTFRATKGEDPMTISYNLMKVGDNDTIFRVVRPFGGGNDAPGTTVFNSACLDLDGCYTFTIRNRAYRPALGPQRGSYTLRLGEVVLAQFHGMTDGCFRRKWYQFGTSCEFQTGTEPVGARRCGD